MAHDGVFLVRFKKLASPVARHTISSIKCNTRVVTGESIPPSYGDVFPAVTLFAENIILSDK